MRPARSPAHAAAGLAPAWSVIAAARWRLAAGPLLLGLASLAIVSPACADGAAPDSAFFVATTRALLDAVTAGDRAVWARWLDPAWIQSDEEGHPIGRDSMLAGLHPLPAGQSGTLTLGAWRLSVSGDVAVFVYDVDETHDVHGQRLRTRFHTTDTWVRRADGWRQLASQVTALPTPVRGMHPDPGWLRREAGRYALGPDLTLDVIADDTSLTVRREGRPPQPLHALDDRIFVRDGARGFWVFESGPDGRVDRLVQWRDNNPVVWRRVADLH